MSIRRVGIKVDSLNGEQCLLTTESSLLRSKNFVKNLSCFIHLSELAGGLSQTFLVNFLLKVGKGDEIRWELRLQAQGLSWALGDPHFGEDHITNGSDPWLGWDGCVDFGLDFGLDLSNRLLLLDLLMGKEEGRALILKGQTKRARNGHTWVFLGRW